MWFYETHLKADLKTTLNCLDNLKLPCNLNAVFLTQQCFSLLLFQVPNDPPGQLITAFDMEKVMTTIKQFVRDWSDEVTLTTDETNLQ